MTANRLNLRGPTSVSLVIRLAGIALNFLALLVLARALDPAELGLWAWAGEVVALLCVVSAAGFNMIAIRVVPDCLVARDAAGLRRFVRAGLLAGLVGSAISGLAILAAWSVGWLLPGLNAAMAALMVAVLFAFTALRFSQEVMRGAGRLVLAQVGEQVVWPMLLMAAALGLWFLPVSGSAVAMLLAAQLLAFAALWVLLATVSERIIADITAPEAAPQAGPRKWLAGGISLAVCAALSVFLKRGDMIVLGALGDAREVALYAPASRYAALLVLGQAAASMVSGSRMRTMWRTGNRAELQHNLDQMAAISVLFAAPLCLALWLFPGSLLGLFGAEFTAAAGVLQVLALAQLINCWTGPVACAVVACDLERAFTAMTATAAALLLALLFALVPRWGMIGAATASMAGIATLNVGMAAIVWRKTGLKCWARPAAFAGFARQTARAA